MALELTPTLSIKEFNGVLNAHKYRELDNETRYQLYNFFINHGCTFQDAFSILAGAKKKAIIMADTDKYVKLDVVDMLKNYSTNSDIIVYKRIDQIDKKFKEYYSSKNIKTPAIDKLITSCYKAIKVRNEKFNDELGDFTLDQLDELFYVACIYNSINEYFNDESEQERLSDYVVGQKLATIIENNKQLKLDAKLNKKFAGFLESISKVDDVLPKEEAFAAEDVKSLLTKTSSLIYSCNASKAYGVRRVLREYLNELMKRAEDGSIEKEFLNKTTAKSILLKSGSILQNQQVSIGESLDLLLGKTSKEIVDNGNYVATKQADKAKIDFAKNYPNFKIVGFGVAENVNILQNNVTLIRKLNLQTVSVLCDNMVDAIYNTFYPNKEEITTKQKIEQLKILGFNPETLVHKDNIQELISPVEQPMNTEETALRFSDNIKSLSKVLKPNEIQSIINHNVNLLFQDNGKLEQEINQIYILSKGNYKVFKKKMEEYVNGRYSLESLNPTRRTTKKIEMIEKPNIDFLENDNEDVIVENKKDHIDLNNFNVELTKEPVALKKRVYIKPEDKVTASNYFELLMRELENLEYYSAIDNKIKDESLEETTVAGLLNIIGLGQGTINAKGVFVQRVKILQKELNLLLKNDKLSTELAPALQKLKEELFKKQEKLKMELCELEEESSNITLGLAIRNTKEQEQINEYIIALNDIDKSLDSVKSKKLREKYLSDREFLVSRIKEIEKQNKEVGISRKFADDINADWANIKLEEKCLNVVIELLNETGCKINDLKDNSKTPEPKKVDPRAIDDLETTLKKREEWFYSTYKSEKSQSGAHARREYAKIVKMREKLAQLKGELDFN